MSDLNCLLSFRAVSSREANELAEELRGQLERSSPGVAVSQRRERQTTQDLGTVLGVVLGAEAVVAVAKGIAAFLRAHQGASIDIKTEDGRILAKGITSTTALAIVQEALRASREPRAD